MKDYDLIVANAQADIEAAKSSIIPLIYMPSFYPHEDADYTVELETVIQELSNSSYPDSEIQSEMSQFLSMGKTILAKIKSKNEHSIAHNEQVNAKIQQIEAKFVEDMKGHPLTNCDGSIKVSYGKLEPEMIGHICQAMRELDFKAIEITGWRVKGVYIKADHPHISLEIIQKIEELSGSPAKFIRCYMEQNPFKIATVQDYLNATTYNIEE